jgi:hypothetical protein
MTVGLWTAPAVLASLSAILWAATWLEHLVVPPASGPELRMPDAVEARFTPTPAHPESLGSDGQPAAELGSKPT